MCDDSFHIIMSSHAARMGSQTVTERVTPLALPLARAVTPIEKTPCLHSHAYLLVHFSAKMPFT